MSDEMIIVCARVESIDPIPGSLIVKCVRCQRDVWLSPSGQAALTEATAVWCLHCARMEWSAHPEDNQFAILPGALAEWRAAIDADDA